MISSKSFFSNIKHFFSSNEEITLAVVGLPSSGKSYLLSDIITSFRRMGYSDYPLERQDISYKQFGAFKAKISSSGIVSKTEVYALRPDENIYGAKLVNKRINKTIELTFADIPGELFSKEPIKEDSKHKYTFLDVYSEYLNRLNSSSCGKVFEVTTWKNASLNDLKVVKPIITNKSENVRFEKIIKAVDEDSSDMTVTRTTSNFLKGKNVFLWLKDNGFTEDPSSKKIIDGKELLENFFQYQPDSLMQALSYKVKDICPGLNLESFDFEAKCCEPFYLLHYLAVASDIVVCDKLLVPEGTLTDKTDNNPLPYDVMVEQLSNFVKIGAHNVYLAFRGVDFLIKEKANNYKNLCNSIKSKFGLDNDKICNLVYSLFAYLLWHKVGVIPEINNISDPDLLILGKPIAFIKSANDLSNDYIDMNLGESCIIGDENANAEQRKNSLLELIKAHIGDDSAHGFRHLLHSAYGFDGHTYGMPALLNVPPHAYFTCTPITSDFNVYTNDPDNGFRRFVNADLRGPRKYFDTCGSHFCFGSYQLCLDILNRHGVSVIDFSSFGNFLNSTQNHE